MKGRDWRDDLKGFDNKKKEEEAEAEIVIVEEAANEKLLCS